MEPRLAILQARGKNPLTARTAGARRAHVMVFVRGAGKAPSTRRWSPVIAAALVLGLAAFSLHAQIATSTLAVDTVVGDGAPLPGVTVVVVNPETGTERRGVADELGRVLLAALPPGDYRISAERAGFETAVVESLPLLVGDTTRLRLRLRPQIEDTLEVSGEAPLVDVYRSDAAANVVPEQIRELPVVDRKFERLAFITPGVQSDRVDYLDRTGAPVVGAGANSAQVLYMVDGVELSEPSGGLTRQRLSQDAVREFRVSRQGFDAELGGSTSGAISIVTHSGTNDLRGTVYGFYRSDALRSEGALEVGGADTSRTQLGLAIGGPVVRDRTHFFASLEHLDDNQVAYVRPFGEWEDQAADVQAPVELTTVLLSLDHRFRTSSSGSARLFWERYRQTNYDVGGVRDESHGWRWDRDAWTLVLGHTWVIGESRLNELRGQLASRDVYFPANSSEVGEWFSFGTTLQTDGHWVGPDGRGLGRIAEIRDTFTWQLGHGRHQLKAGASWLHYDQDYREDRFGFGLLVYATDDRSSPYRYLYGEGSSRITYRTNYLGVFVHDDWRPNPRLTIGLGLRYDLDTNGNNPNLVHPVLTGTRSVDTDNIQPRLSFTWDATGDGRTMIRGGVGRFVGRFNNLAAVYELQFNGITARTLRQNVSVDQLDIWIDPGDPQNTGLPLAPDIYLLGDEAPSPESIQAGLGLSQRLGSTGLRLEVDAVYVEGDNEIALGDSNWRGNDDPCQDDPTTAAVTCRIDPAYNQIERYTSEGRSRYVAGTVAVNGTLSGGHLLTASLTVADRKSIADEFSDINAQPSDPADIGAEWGRSNTDERYRLVISGVFRLPRRWTVAPIYEYGSGQPWNRVLGFDANGDGYYTDRGEGVARNDQDGPTFSQLSLRLTKGVSLGRGEFELMLEVFNLFNTTNYDVGSVVNNELIIDPQTFQFVPNPDLGAYTATLPPREIQLGLRYSF